MQRNNYQQLSVNHGFQVSKSMAQLHLQQEDQSASLQPENPKPESSDVPTDDEQHVQEPSHDKRRSNVKVIKTKKIDPDPETDRQMERKPAHLRLDLETPNQVPSEPSSRLFKEKSTDCEIESNLKKLTELSKYYRKKQKKDRNVVLKIRRGGKQSYQYIEEQRTVQTYDTNSSRTVQDFLSSDSGQNRFMIRLNNSKKTNWDIFIIVLAIYNSFQIPFEIAFEPPEMETSKFFIANTIIDLCFVVDILVAFRTTFYDPSTGDEIFDAKRIAKEYILGRFIIDFLSTVPFDNIALMITQTRSPMLQLFTLLKLFRVTRLSRIIERMNVKQDAKNGLKLFNLIFMIIVYVHCLASLWFVIVKNDQKWFPPLDLVNPDAEIYYESRISHQYFIAVYHAVLLLTGNDILPMGTFQVAFCAIFITIGAIINANIFGNMALIISELNKKSAEFQSQIDTANTAMKNMHLPQTLQSKIISYLQYIQRTLDHQNELREFFSIIKPSLKEKVISFVFQDALESNPILKNHKGGVQNFISQKIELIMSQPEEIQVQQGDQTAEFFIIAKGECECFVKDENNKETFVKVLQTGQFFGEIAYLTGNRRTATIQTKNYSQIGKVSRDHFQELCFNYPEIKKGLMDNLRTYQDKFKTWQKEQLRNINYFQYLGNDILEMLVYELKQEYFEQGQLIFKHNDPVQKIYILAAGEIETFLPLQDADMNLDFLKVPGSVLCQYTVLQQKISHTTYSAKALCETQLLVLSMDTINKVKEKEEFRQMKKFISRMHEEIQANGLPMLDYVICRKQPRVMSIADEDSFNPKLRFKQAVQKVITIQRFNRKKSFKFADLLKYMKEQATSKEEEQERKQTELYNTLKPLIQKKIEKVITDSIEKLLGSVQKSDGKMEKITAVLRTITQNEIQDTIPGQVRNQEQVFTNVKVSSLERDSVITEEDDETTPAIVEAQAQAQSKSVNFSEVMAPIVREQQAFTDISPIGNANSKSNAQQLAFEAESPAFEVQGSPYFERNQAREAQIALGQAEVETYRASGDANTLKSPARSEKPSQFKRQALDIKEPEIEEKPQPQQAINGSGIFSLDDRDEDESENTLIVEKM